MPACFPKWLCQFTLPPAVCKSPGCSIFLTWHHQAFQFLPGWSSVFWRQPTVYTDSREIILASQGPAPGSEERTTHNGTIWGGIEMVPVLANRVREPKSRGSEGERESRKEQILMIENFSLLSVPFLSGSNIFNNRACHPNESSLLLELILHLNFGSRFISSLALGSACRALKSCALSFPSVEQDPPSPHTPCR